MNRNLGIDVKLQEQRLIPSQNGDLQWVGDLANLEQSLRNRIRTAIGNLPFHPEYGSEIPLMLSRPNTAVLLGRIYTALGSVFMAEPRVKKVTHLSVIRKSSNTIEISATILPITETVERNILLEIEYPS